MKSPRTRDATNPLLFANATAGNPLPALLGVDFAPGFAATVIETRRTTPVSLPGGNYRNTSLFDFDEFFSSAMIACGVGIFPWKRRRMHRLRAVPRLCRDGSAIDRRVGPFPRSGQTERRRDEMPRTMIETSQRARAAPFTTLFALHRFIIPGTRRSRTPSVFARTIVAGRFATR